MNNKLVERLKKIKYQEWKKLFEHNYHTFFDNGDYNLNIFGVRNSVPEPDSFNDAIGIIYRENGEEKVEIYNATTDAGLYWMQKPMSTGGTAFMVEGQYKGLWQIGYHFHIMALTQRTIVACYRDNNRDDIIDLEPRSITKGIYGINFHPAWAVEKADKVGQWSAGCQVTQYRADFDYILSKCQKGSVKWGNSFTYTLFRQDQIFVN